MILIKKITTLLWKQYNLLDIYSYSAEINSIIKEPLNIKIGNKRKGDAISLVANIDKLKKKLQWNPKYNDLKKILDTSIKWEEKIINEKIL